MKKILKTIRPIFIMALSFLVLCGVIYPLLLTGIGQSLFPHKANGSLIEVNGKTVGSELIGQDFTDPRFMKCRPSAVNYNTYSSEDKDNGTYKGVSSGSTNLATTSEDLANRVKNDIDTFLTNNPTIKKEDIPTDLLTASGSGLDPHISPESAKIQIPQISKETGISESDLIKIVEENTTDKVLGTFGENTVNVLKVNLEISKYLKY